MKNKKIIHICSSLVYGGGEEHVRTILAYLQNRGVPVCAAVPEGTQLYNILKKTGIEVFPLYIGHKFHIKSVYKLCGLLRAHCITLIHTHNRREDLIGAICAKMLNIASVTTIHDRINMDQNGNKVVSFGSSVYHFILRNCFDALITVSKATYDDISACAKVNREKVYHVINGLDLKRIIPSINKNVMKRKIGLNENKKIIGFVARIRNSSFGKKGILYLIEAAVEVAKYYPNSKFVVSGEDDEAAKILKKICAKKKISDYFVFLGYRKDVIDIMQCFDMLICPSLFEGLPRVVLESMALGVPVIGSNVDGIPEVIDDGKCGYLVQPKDASALADRILRLLKNQDTLLKFGKNSAEKIKKQFRAELSAEQTEQIYIKILEKRQ
ncbi:glycosyltransferase family 4 protein [bacterium]|nr:glycosyltransferase family 4 protein [bacterium]